MDLSISSVKIVGNQGKTSWVYPIGSKNLFVIIESEKIIDAQTINNFFNFLSTGKSKNTNLTSNLHEALKLYLSNLNNIHILGIRMEKDSFRFNEAGSVNSVIFEGGNLDLYRSNMHVRILESTGGTISARGHPQGGDILLLSTLDYINDLTINQVKFIAEGKPFNLEASNEKTFGTFFIKFSQEKKSIRLSLVKFIDLLLNRLPKRIIFVRSAGSEIAKESNKKTTMVVGLILLLLLIVSVLLGIKHKNSVLFKASYEPDLKEARNDLSEAISLFSLDAPRSRDLYSNAKKISQNLNQRKISDPQIDKLSSDIRESAAKILGEYEKEGQMYLDLSLLSSGFKGDIIKFTDNKIYVLDKSGSKLISINIDTKKTGVVAGPDQINGAINTTSYSGRPFVLTDKGIYEIGKGLVIEKDWQGEVWPMAYTGNIYLLDKNNSTIWRYTSLTSGVFAGKQKWFGTGFSVNFSNINSWAIDGSIWISKADGEVLKYSLGAPAAFSLAQVEPPLTTIQGFYTDENQTNLYILDPTNSRVLVFDKEGNYKAVYISDKIKDSNDFIVSEQQKLIILLSGDKLYSLDIKHL